MSAPQAKRSMNADRFGVISKPKDGKKTFIRLFKETKGARNGLALILVFSFCIAMFNSLIPSLLGTAVNKIYTKQNVIALLFVIAFVYIVDFLARFLQEYLMAPVSQKVIHYLRCKLFTKYSTLPLSFFDNSLHGDLISRITNDIDNISSTFSESFAKLVIHVISFAGTIIAMFILSPLMACVVMIVSPCVVLLVWFVTKHTRGYYRNMQHTLGTLTGELEEDITGYHVIKAFSQEDKVINDFRAHNEKLCQIGIKATTWSGILMPAMNVLQNVDFIIIVIIGSVFAVKGYITIGLISAFTLYARQFMRPLNEVAGIYNTLQSALSAAERVFEIIDKQDEDFAVKALTEKEIVGDIEIENINFSYVEGKKIIKNLSLSIKHGMKVALVGETGCGKTTLINLLTRMYDVDDGAILLDGKNLKDYDLTELRSLFSVVLQDSRLFSKSVYENLCYGSKIIDKELCETVCKEIGVDSFIRRLPQQYDTILDSSAMLSEGERQLLTIARAIIKNSPLIILDEATSNVDTVTERKIKKAIDKITNGRTSIFIAHRLSTIKDSDLIVLLDHGEIVEQGTHEELLALNRRYAAMYKLQIGSNIA